MSHSRIFMILFIHDSNKLSRSSLTLCDRNMTPHQPSVSLYKLLSLANIHSDAQHAKTLNMCEYIYCHSGLNVRRHDLLG